MVTLNNSKEIKINTNEVYLLATLSGLSDDTKPTTFNGFDLYNGSVFIELDTQKLSFYNQEDEQWEELD